jgi:hypothetical protein
MGHGALGLSLHAKPLVPVGTSSFERLARNRFEFAGRRGCEGFDVLSPENPHTKRVTGRQQHQDQHRKNDSADDDALSVAVQVCDSRHSCFSLLLSGAYGPVGAYDNTYYTIIHLFSPI